MNKFALTSLFVTLFLSAKVNADEVVASNLPASQLTSLAWEEIGMIAPRYNNYNNDAKAQQFIPTASGVLSTVDALIAIGAPAPLPETPPLNVSIYTSNDGIPISKLATRTFSAADFLYFLDTGNTTRTTIDFGQSNVSLVAGNQYLIAFETPYGVPSVGFSLYEPYLVGYPQKFLGLNASQARDGIHWEQFSGLREIAITVSIVPEPGTGYLLVAFIAISTCRFGRSGSRT